MRLIPNLRGAILLVAICAVASPGLAQSATARLEAFLATDPVTWFPLGDPIRQDAEQRASLAALDLCNAIDDAGPAIRARAVYDAEAALRRAEAETLIALIGFVDSAYHFTAAGIRGAVEAGREGFGPNHIDITGMAGWIARVGDAAAAVRADVDAARDLLRAGRADAGTPSEAALAAGRAAARAIMEHEIGVFAAHFFVTDLLRQRETIGGAGVAAPAADELNRTDPATFERAQMNANFGERDALFEEMLAFGVDAALARASLIDDVSRFETALFDYAVAAETHRLVEDCAGAGQIIFPRSSVGTWDLRGPLVIEMPYLEGGALYGSFTMYIWGGDDPRFDGDVNFVIPAPDFEGWDAIRRGQATANRGALVDAALGPDNSLTGTLRVFNAADFANIDGALELRLVGTIEENEADDGWTARGTLLAPETMPEGWAALLDFGIAPGPGDPVGTWETTIEIPLGFFERE